jgi:hypothetical protein
MVVEWELTMEIISKIEIVAGLGLTIWSIGLVWASWRVHKMVRELSQELAAVRRWVRLKGLRERQNGGRWR